MDRFRYIFRFAADPGFGDDRALRDMLRFCILADIDEVAVFTAGEEINSGHITLEEQSKWIEFMSRVKEELRNISVDFSINHWTSFLPADRGRILAPEQNFTKMTDIDGLEASAVVCPLCPEFKAYFLEIVRRFAKLGPHIFWIEDDFRFHNHDPLRWGGCFCELHMREYSARAGENLQRGEFIEKLLAPGILHPARKAWLDCCRDTLIALAREIATEIHKISPDTKIGLMSSDPSVHCAEGRDWHGLLSAFADGGTPVHRIHLPSYLERTPQDYLWRFNTVSMLCRAMGPSEAVIYPELENFPFSRFTKSLRFTRFQIESALALGIDGITLDLFDICGSGILFEDGHQDNLAEIKPFLNSCLRSKVFDRRRTGICVLFSSESSYTLHTQKGVSMEELYPEESFWGGVFGGMGIPFYYENEPKRVSGKIVAASGQVFRNLPSDEIRRLFEENYLILDGQAANVLLDMGLGELAALSNSQMQAQNTGVVSYEEFTESVSGYAVPRAAAQVFLGDAFLFGYQSERIRMISQLKNFQRNTTAPGAVVVDEKVLIVPFYCKEYPPMMFNRLRQRCIQDELKKAARRYHLPCLIEAGVHMAVYSFSQEDKQSFYLVNGSIDPVHETHFFCPQYTGTEAKITSPRGEEMIALKKTENDFILPFSLAGLECILIELGAADQ